MLDSAGAWSAAWGNQCSSAAGQWMQIDMGSNFRVHGVVTQCRPCCHQCVTEIEVQYSLTTSDFVSARTAGGSTRFSLPTTFDSNVKTSSIFSTPVTARYIKIIVHAWVDYASIRAAVLTLSTTISNACADCGAGKYSSTTGATTASVCADCTIGQYSATSASTCMNCAAGKYQDTVVVTTNPPETSRTYSSVCCGDSAGGPHGSSMLDNANSWCAGAVNPAAYGSWVQVDLGSIFRVHGVVVQPRGDAYAASISGYYSGNVEWELQYSTSTSDFVSAISSTDSNRFTSTGTAGTQAKSELNFKTPVLARYIKMIAQVITNTHLCVRVGVRTSSMANFNVCTDCAVGTYSSTSGATTASVCVDCSAGKYSATGSDAATDCVCVAGYSGPDGGACTACVAGKYKANPGSAVCTDCMPNSYHALTEQTAASACFCNAGTHDGVAVCVPTLSAWLALFCATLSCHVQRQSRSAYFRHSGHALPLRETGCCGPAVGPAAGHRTRGALAVSE